MDADLWMSTLQFVFGGVLLYLPLFWLFPTQTFHNSRRAIVMGASLFWLAWGYYYRFFYPAWMQWGAALIAFVLYSIYAFACHWLACRLPGASMLGFYLFTGLLAVNEARPGDDVGIKVLQKVHPHDKVFKLTDE